MSDNAYYVYALKDPRESARPPFYIGKGTGNRAWDHLVSPDDSPRGKRIKSIQNDGCKVLISILADGLTEFQALKLESELISAFGTVSTGGCLTNVVIPNGEVAKVRKGLFVPFGVKEKAQIGLKLLKESVLELSKANEYGITNSDASRSLGLQSNYQGGSKDYLTWSVLGLLMKEGKVVRVNRGKGNKGYHVAQVD